MLHMMYHGHGHLNRFEGFFRSVSRVCQARHIYHTFWDFGTSPRHHPTKFDLTECSPPQKSPWNASSADGNCDPPPPYPAQRETERETDSQKQQSQQHYLVHFPCEEGRNLTSSGSSWNPPSKQWGSQETHWRLSHPPCWGTSTTNCSSRRLHATQDELGPSHGHGYGCTHNPPAPVIKIATTNSLLPQIHSHKKESSTMMWPTIGYSGCPMQHLMIKPTLCLVKEDMPYATYPYPHAYPPAPVLTIATNQLPYSLPQIHSQKESPMVWPYTTGCPMRNLTMKWADLGRGEKPNAI